MSRTSDRHLILKTLVWVVFTTAIVSPLAQGQYLGLNLRGDMGLKSGSQPIPGFYLIAPLYFRSDYNGLRGPNGNSVATNLDIDVSLFTVPAISATTKAKF